MEEHPEGDPGTDGEPADETPVMPRWVPAVIGLVLVAMAALAVYTGLRYRNPTLANGIIRSRRAPRTTNGGGAPGEPGPGASLVLPGESGDNAPSPNAPVAGRARAEISGGREGVAGAMRFTARRGMTIAAIPDDAMVLVNETPIGEAKQLAGPYEFPQSGSYTVRITAPGFKDKQFVVTASDAATQEVVAINAKLEKQ